MTACEFLDSYKPSLLACVKSMDYKASEVAKKIRSLTPEIVNTQEYRETVDVYIDETSSCDVGEAIDWMAHVVKMAIQYGIDTKNMDWKVKFMAAWNISQNLIGNRGECVA